MYSWSQSPSCWFILLFCINHCRLASSGKSSSLFLSFFAEDKLRPFDYLVCLRSSRIVFVRVCRLMSPHQRIWLPSSSLPQSRGCQAIQVAGDTGNGSRAALPIGASVVQ
ncbi:hypothetical protein BX661DRAFT_182003 [Kickxella alabastrina]|uniref:uncharacterized protein n=1 Tax=Kickxella alabastrina TaxID=61397 RepID=UPI00221F4A15|nr:uncharacterized protein BX661DRAFT_182003 [Kickxella alabastrina]KAI7828398.1 hypothetical protein BX661DRAFT_182003 [Kickxella alabastrina]